MFGTFLGTYLTSRRGGRMFAGLVVDGNKHPVIGLLVTVFIALPTGAFIWFVVINGIIDSFKKKK
jgi:hypothetical protein